MRKQIFALIMLMGLGTSVAWAQKGDWAVHSYISTNLMFGDTDFDHPTKGLSPGVGFALQYGLTDDLRLYTDASLASINGGGNEYYFEHQNLTGILGLQYDLLGAFTNEPSKFAVFIDGAIGWSYFQSIAYNTNTNEVIAKVPADGAYSASPMGSLGGSISYAIANQVDVVLGYKTFMMIDNDWGDAQSGGAAESDYFGQISIGVRYSINGHEPMAKVPQGDYDDLVAAKKAAEQEAEEARQELETARRKYDTQIEDLYNILSVMNNNIDSLEQKITVLRSKPESNNEYVVESRGGQPVTPDATNTKWRIVIGSFPNAQMANEFAAQRVVEGGEYEVVFIADLNTYRVVYNSYGTLNAAKTDLERVKSVITNAWIIRF
ncbi:SPOR domain-containing protein [Phaeocystidibacter luteus]|uniref:SPOR domain-containing protein n=1 Tax=Phaeocystidibacter luteus TaxID=911197 RepID=A0A6N6RIK1_9FLAO|nr:SPOR domain-containing protein [Phaeocystidibacter luteus]KAB2814104.1 SPOR domain-containing protein [Phaeocystidibacter luteus]